MKIRFLGTGTSTGIPEIGCRCNVCTSPDSKDKRLRSSALIHTGTENILIDCGPDFRTQLIEAQTDTIDGVLLTHEHYDHTGGLDDLRPFCKDRAVSLYLEPNVEENLRLRLPYCFNKNKYPGVPKFDLQSITSLDPFFIGKTEIIPIRVMHLQLPILGYRIGDFAYLTDMLYMPEEEYEKLIGVKTIAITALRKTDHISHQTLPQALQAIKRIRPQNAYLIHMSHHMGLHEETSKELPPNVFFAYDGLEIEIHSER